VPFPPANSNIHVPILCIDGIAKETAAAAAIFRFLPLAEWRELAPAGALQSHNLAGKRGEGLAELQTGLH
jgi:hypothetical protein